MATRLPFNLSILISWLQTIVPRISSYLKGSHPSYKTLTLISLSTRTISNRNVLYWIVTKQVRSPLTKCLNERDTEQVLIWQENWAKKQVERKTNRTRVKERWPLFSEWVESTHSWSLASTCYLFSSNWLIVISIIIPELLWSTMYNYISFYFPNSLSEPLHTLAEGSLISSNYDPLLRRNAKGQTWRMKVNPLLKSGLQESHI